MFDGVCVLCSAWARFVLRHDRHGEFKLAAMQASIGRELLERHGIDPNDPAAFLVIDGPDIYSDTNALIHVLKHCGMGWRGLALALHIVPRRVRDWLYRYIARNRYRFFGRRASCMLPDPEHRSRFLM